MASSAPLCLSVLFFLFLCLQSPVLSYRYYSTACSPRYRGTLTVTGIQVWNVNRYWRSSPNVYIKIRHGTYQRQTHMIRSNSPRWSTRYSVSNAYTRTPLRIELWERRSWRSICLQACTNYLQQGYKSFTCRSGTRRIDVKYTLSCSNRCSRW